MPEAVAPRTLSVAAAALLAACGASPAPGAPSAPAGSAPAAPAWQSPPTPRGDVVDDYHGTKVADPYRALEDVDAPATRAWIATQNTATRHWLDAVPERAEIRARLQELWRYTRHGVPSERGGHWFFQRHDPDRNQPVWITADAPEQEGRVLLDPNQLDANGTTAVRGFAPSEDGRRVAFAFAQAGSDWTEWRVFDTATGERLADTVPWSKFAGAAWTHDGQGFFYQRYPQPAPGQERSAPTRNAQLCYHRLGTAAAADRIVYERPDQPEWGFSPTVTEDGRFLIVRMSHGTDRRTRIGYVDLQDPAWPVQPLLMAFDATWDFLGNDGDTFWFRTDLEAPRGRILAIDRKDLAPEHRRTLVAEAADTLERAAVVGEHFACLYLHDAAHRLLLHKLDGTADGQVVLPGLGAVRGLGGRRHDESLWFSFESFAQAPSIWRHDFASRNCRPVHQPRLPFAADDFVTEEVFPQSRDGTRLALFLVHRRGVQLDGRNPTLLYGYGGFGVPMTPSFRLPDLVFVERGGVFAQAVLRGGSEYGEAWHQAGMLEHKGNVFADFVACAEYLQRNGWCTKERLGILGGSNGGLLVGAALTQRPDLFGAAVPEVGVLDMLRYHRFTIGRAWAPEYGTSEDQAQFGSLYAYSPLHRVAPGTHYPATLVTTGDHDDRVVPGHSFKFAATLQAAQAGPAPILLRVETDAGHGAGKPVAKQIDEAADVLAFLARALR